MFQQSGVFNIGQPAATFTRNNPVYLRFGSHSTATPLPLALHVASSVFSTCSLRALCCLRPPSLCCFLPFFLPFSASALLDECAGLLRWWGRMSIAKVSHQGILRSNSWMISSLVGNAPSRPWIGRVGAEPNRQVAHSVSQMTSDALISGNSPIVFHRFVWVLRLVFPACPSSPLLLCWYCLGTAVTVGVQRGVGRVGSRPPPWSDDEPAAGCSGHLVQRCSNLSAPLCSEVSPHGSYLRFCSVDVANTESMPIKDFLCYGTFYTLCYREYRIYANQGFCTALASRRCLGSFICTFHHFVRPVFGLAPPPGSHL